MRPALVTLLSLVLGIYLGSLQLLTAEWYLLGVALATLLLILSRWLKPIHSGISWYIVIICTGACLATIPRERVAQLPTPSREATYLVTISRPPSARERGYRVAAIIEQAIDESGQILSSWSGQRVMLYLYSDTLKVKPHNTYTVQGRLTTLDKVSLENYQHYLLSRHVSGVLSAHTALPSQRDERAQYWTAWDQLRYYAYTIQQRIASTLDQVDNLTPLQRETIRAICLGDRSEGVVSEAQFRSIGVAHLLSVSGFHVGVVLLLIYWLIRYPLRLIRNVSVAYHIRWSLTLAAVWFYAFICGLSIPTLRATLMFSIFAVARLLGRPTNRLNVWGEAAIILLVLSPYSLFDVGMQLSFGAVLALFVTWGEFSRHITPSGSSIIRYLFYLLVTTVAVQLFVWPILARSFGTISVWLLLANLLLSPLTTLLIIIGLLTMGILAFGLPTQLLPILLVGISDLTSWTTSLLEKHFTTQLDISMPLWLCILYYLILYAWVQYLSTKKLHLHKRI